MSSAHPIEGMLIPVNKINSPGTDPDETPADASAIQPVIDSVGKTLFTMSSPSGIPLFYYIFLNYRRYMVAKPKIWHIYNEYNAGKDKSVFEPYADYKDPSVLKPIKIFAQKEGTCGTDAVYNILFECDVLKQYFLKSDLYSSPPKYKNIKNFCVKTPAGDEPDSYVHALEIAKARYDRMKSIEATIPAPTNATKPHYVFPRSNSVKNNLWKNPHGLISSYPHSADSKELTYFLHKLLGENILNIPDLPKMDAIEYDRDNKQFPDPMSLDNVVAFILTMANVGSPRGHFVSFYKNGTQWFCADNDVGYVHEITDTEWLTTIFWPRLMNMMKLYKEGKPYYEFDPEQSIYIRMLSIPNTFLKNQFITPGERFYPNINPDDIPDLGNRATVWYPAGVMPIFYTGAGGAATGGVAAGAALTGAATAGGARLRRNSRRRRQRKHSRKTRRSSL